MGEASRRKAQKKVWYSSLTGDEQIVADVSQQVHQRCTRTDQLVGACYFYALFLRKYLREEKNIEVTRVVGWASSARALFAHGWIEFNGKCIDISLTQMQPESAHMAGHLIVLDQMLSPWNVTYTYWAVTTPAIEAQLAADAPHGQRPLAEVARMRAIAADDAKIDAYFNDAPPQYSYSNVLALLC